MSKGDLVALTGGTGFVGSHAVVTSLINANSPLVWDATMRAPPREPRLVEGHRRRPREGRRP